MMFFIMRVQVLLLIYFLCIQHFGGLIIGSGLRCPENERDALLEFKAGVTTDQKARLSSWAGRDCCRWSGVACSNTTGNVVTLDLRNPDPPINHMLYNDFSLGGSISPSLLALKHLTYLDLSFNYFQGNSIPSFFGSFKQLSYLNLSLSGFSGLIPPQLGNLSSLRYLDLNFDIDTSFPYVTDGLWLSGLSSLRYLDMGGSDLSKAGNWFRALSSLPFITEVHLAECQLATIPQSLPITNFTFLSFLDLKLNGINSTVPEYLYSIKSLRHLDLGSNDFHRPISAAIGNLTSLEYLDLSETSPALPRTIANLCNLRTLHLEGGVVSNLTEFGQVLNGCVKNSLQELDLSNSRIVDRLPDWMGDLRSLRILDLSFNNLYGAIPASSIGRLSSLESLDLSSNGLTGPVSENLGQLSKLATLDLSYNLLRTTLTEAHFANLKSLKTMNLINSSLTLNIASDWIAPFQLEMSYTPNVRQGPQFPHWLKNQEKIHYLDMSGAGISDSIPDWFWNVTSHISNLYLSDNDIRGKLPRSLNFPTNVPVSIDLRSNLLEGRLPSHFPPSVEDLYLSNNLFSGPIPPTIGNTESNLSDLSLSSNNFIGTIPSSICNLKHLTRLDISKNQLSGEIPDCLHKVELQHLNLGTNNLSGAFPSSIASLFNLILLDLSNNSFHGPLPEYFKSDGLDTLDLSNNKFTGTIPSWIGEGLLWLKVLSLRSNEFVGVIPPQLSILQSLQILDLSDNKLSGNIPPAFYNLSGMKTGPPDPNGIFYLNDLTDDVFGLKMWVSSKGRYMEYNGNTLFLLTFMDLSSNNLSGQIPEELTQLLGLQVLNLSGNHFTGIISKNFGELQSLETLDFSMNELSGPIPSSLSGLHFLSHLNLSYNHLVGRIPYSGQLETLNDPSIYAGNDGLCGLPLNICASDNTSEVPSSGKDRDHDDWSGWLWFYLGLLPGFLVGFWIFCGALLLKRQWRYAYFHYTDNILSILSKLLGMGGLKKR